MSVMTDHVNQVELRGSIVHKYRAGDWLVITLATSIHQPNRDFPKVYWYDDLVEVIDKEYNVGDRVEVICCIRTSKAHPDPSLVGISIERQNGWLDSRFNANDYKADQNEVLIKGEFIRAFIPSPDITIATVKTVINGYSYFPRITCFGRHAAKAADIKPGTTVYFVAHVQTKKKDTEEGIRHYQSVICRNMRVS